jgi:hypothetical protein
VRANEGLQGTARQRGCAGFAPLTRLLNRAFTSQAGAYVILASAINRKAVLEVFGSDRTHGAFVLRAIERMIALVVLPG